MAYGANSLRSFAWSIVNIKIYMTVPVKLLSIVSNSMLIVLSVDNKYCQVLARAYMVTAIPNPAISFFVELLKNLLSLNPIRYLSPIIKLKNQSVDDILFAKVSPPTPLKPFVLLIFKK